jgi:hypothetical protein
MAGGLLEIYPLGRCPCVYGSGVYSVLSGTLKHFDEKSAGVIRPDERKALVNPRRLSEVISHKPVSCEFSVSQASGLLVQFIGPK